jgi:uracil phosphoribosyltransferase
MSTKEASSKIMLWLGANGASIIAAVQAVLKAVKELITAVINLVSIFLPNKTWHVCVYTVRIFINTLDEKLDVLKHILLKEDDD